MTDAVKIIADGIRVDKKLLKTGAHGKRQTRRSITSDTTVVGKTSDAIIVNATAGGATKDEDNSATPETETSEVNNESSVNRTEDDKESEEDA